MSWWKAFVKARVGFVIVLLPNVACAAGSPAAASEDAALPGAEYHIYRGNTHAHTSFTASHGEQLTNDKKDQDAESGLQVDATGVQRAPKGKVLKPDWQKYQGPPGEHYARARTNGYDFYVITDHS